MKILQIQTQAEAGGAQRVSDMVGDGLRRAGHTVSTVFMYRKTGAYDRDPNAVFVSTREPRSLFSRLRVAAASVHYIAKQKPDALITYQHFGNVFGALAGSLAGVPVVIANQSGVPDRKGMSRVATWLDKLLGSFGLYERNVVNSQWTEAQFASYPKRYRDRLVRIDHGVSKPDKMHDKRAVRAAFDLPLDRKLIVTTGRLSHEKNQLILVEALAHLPDTHLAIAGAGPMRDGLVSRANALGVGDRVHLVGELGRERVYEFIVAGDVFAFPSIYETFGLSVVEAAIAGVPVVASDLPVLKGVLSSEGDFPAALFFKSGQAADLAAKISDVFADKELASRLSRAGRRLETKYAPERMVRSYEVLLFRA